MGVGGPKEISELCRRPGCVPDLPIILNCREQLVELDLIDNAPER